MGKASKYKISCLGDVVMGKGGSFTARILLLPHPHVTLAALITRLRLNQYGLLDA